MDNGDGDSGQGMQQDARRLWLQLAEREARCHALEARIAHLESSRSWRITAPLRALFGRLSAREEPGLRPPLQAAPHAGEPVLPWTALFDTALQRRGLPPWQASSGTSARYLVDVTELALEDLGAGVQRITRSWLAELVIDPPAGYVLEPVRLSSDGHYVLARGFLARFLGLQRGELGHDAAVGPRPADVFVGLDLCRDRHAQLDPALALLRDAGVEVSLVVPDVLPLQHPEWFPAPVPAHFEAWIGLLAKHANRALCISEDCARNLAHELAARRLEATGLSRSVIPLGSDVAVSAPLPDLPGKGQGIRRLLMVGTLEPRKCHAQALDAFDLLQASRSDIELFIVGHPGWMTEAVAERIRRHPSLGRRLHWWHDADDALLAAAYRSSDLLLMPSLGEGYGLPIVEAGRAGCALLLRDLPVFREVAGDSARYFSGLSGQALAAAIVAWADAPPGQATAPAPGRHWPTWGESAVSIKNETMPGRTPLAGRPPQAGPGMAVGQASPQD